ncbi:FMN-binding protein [Streptomyces acidiscabies]|uniref:FMN-binding protein n=1 Tax=Streptomyces acidiscabies TaxID=42234 RepID=A0AAP6B8W3_9ACTN|nr:FMN-binding protein [Streptomyces acidiscabies]MBP5936201.1 FMN-binding protein [Streptomyces sp. LBUM 1476]MBZ3915857.1 FMN-binding protein [Streptomyces acidiscabies]MDX2960264.1 FMN-binding protein [Streptomyces acidiscabies]MDX3019615.1 FMN-binding protein [Streptomyces acidiscabies]MDX3793284.1 FMN-binding protein [Streptomyces acidiscabies]
MKRAIPVLVLSVVGLVPVFRYVPGVASSSAGNSSAASAPSSSGVAGTVFSGTTIPTEKGDVQVQITYQGGKISAVKMLKQPDHPQTTAAVPKLVAATLSAQSADVDTVSGATITSNGYKKSLQAAIDAHAASVSSGASAGAAAPSGASAGASSGAAASSSKVVDGPTVGTEKGDVQVQVTFDGDAISAVKMLKQPNHPQTTAAVPKLIAETLDAQSADIDTVSGATITSDGYKESLQAAIDAKG